MCCCVLERTTDANMPQSGARKKPFSVKQKKEQLKAKREHKRDVERDEFG